MFPVVPAETAVIKGTQKVENLPKWDNVMQLQKCVKRLHNLEELESGVIDEILKDSILAKKCTNKVIEFGFSLIVFQPAVVTSDRLESFVNLWKPYWTSDCRVICSRNIMLLCQGKQTESSWTILSQLINLMIKKELLSAEQLERECVEFLRQDWPIEVAKKVSQLLYSSLEALGRKADTEIIDWIQWYCSGNDDEQL